MNDIPEVNAEVIGHDMPHGVIRVEMRPHGQPPIVFEMSRVLLASLLAPYLDVRLRTDE